MHCELYSMLNVHRLLQGLYPLADSQRCASLVHKEWPEPARRPSKKKRGNFDLAILPPDRLESATVEQFAAGHVQPAFIVEMGMNCGLRHLQDDASKLEHAGSQGCYLVHLWQPHRGISDEGLKALTAWCYEPRIKVAAAVFGPSGLLVKHLGDRQLSKP
jgi:hypothetical protein